MAAAAVIDGLRQEVVGERGTSLQTSVSISLEHRQMQLLPRTMDNTVQKSSQNRRFCTFTRTNNLLKTKAAAIAVSFELIAAIAGPLSSVTTNVSFSACELMVKRLIYLWACRGSEKSSRHALAQLKLSVKRGRVLRRSDHPKQPDDPGRHHHVNELQVYPYPITEMEMASFFATPGVSPKICCPSLGHEAILWKPSADDVDSMVGNVG